MIDGEQLRRIWDKLWIYFIDKHLLAAPGMILVGVLVLMAAEAIFRDWNKTALYRLFFRRSVSAKIDVVYFLVQTAGIAALLEIVFTFGVALAGSRLADYASGQMSWARISLPGDGILQIAFSFVVYWAATGLFGYWIHRLYHSPIFWQVHRFHHAAPELNFITAYRLHPLESFLRAFEFMSPMIVLRVPDSVLLVAVVAGNFINFCQHSELPWDWGWIGRWIFGSPLVHQIHHSIDEEHRDTNFCNCPLWDHIFGTWYDGTKMPSGYGIPDPAYQQAPFRQFLSDGWVLYTKLGSFLVSPFRKMATQMLSRRATTEPENSPVSTP
jgi:sterol desaturase/sphingolipid hydroxylase (fatty acid hydroxylase superfamily)